MRKKENETELQIHQTDPEKTLKKVSKNAKKWTSSKSILLLRRNRADKEILLAGSAKSAEKIKKTGPENDEKSINTKIRKRRKIYQNQTRTKV